eukprot:SAG31_NODE_15_length_37942_cov_32.078297_19_plen_85_part_00
MSVAMMVPVLPAVAEQWGTAGAGSTIGLILAAPALARLLLNSAAGRLVDTRGRCVIFLAIFLIIEHKRRVRPKHCTCAVCWLLL